VEMPRSENKMSLAELNQKLKEQNLIGSGRFPIPAPVFASRSRPSGPFFGNGRRFARRSIKPRSLSVPKKRSADLSVTNTLN